MALDAQTRNLLDLMAAQGAPPIEQTTPGEARALRATMRANFSALAGTPVELPRVEDRTIPGPDGPIPVRCYWPVTASPLPTLVYFHGGGWVLGDLDTHDGSCRALAKSSGCLIISVDYRLAPENKYPAPLDDSFAAVKYIAEHANEFGADASRLAVGGDSAGGNLAAAVALLAKERGGPNIAFQLLIYPVTDYAATGGSIDEFHEGYFLTRAGMHWFWQQYLTQLDHGSHPLVSPLRAENLAGLPPAFIITAQYDPLRDQAEAYAKRLKEAGVWVRLERYDSTIHGFFGMAAVLDVGKQAVRDASEALSRALGKKSVAAS